MKKATIKKKKEDEEAVEDIDTIESELNDIEKENEDKPKEDEEGVDDLEKERIEYMKKNNIKTTDLFDE